MRYDVSLGAECVAHRSYCFDRALSTHTDRPRVSSKQAENKEGEWEGGRRETANQQDRKGGMGESESKTYMHLDHLIFRHRLLLRFPWFLFIFCVRCFKRLGIFFPTIHTLEPTIILCVIYSFISFGPAEFDDDIEAHTSSFMYIYYFNIFCSSCSFVLF